MFAVFIFGTPARQPDDQLAVRRAMVLSRLLFYDHGSRSTTVPFSLLLTNGLPPVPPLPHKHIFRVFFRIPSGPPVFPSTFSPFLRRARAYFLLTFFLVFCRHDHCGNRFPHGESYDSVTRTPETIPCTFSVSPRQRGQSPSGFRDPPHPRAGGLFPKGFFFAHTHTPNVFFFPFFFPFLPPPREVRNDLPLD